MRSSLFALLLASSTLLGQSTATPPISFQGKGMGGWVASYPNEVTAMNFSWFYNWGNTRPAGAPQEIEYIPMIWGGGNIDSVRDTLGRLVAEGYDTVLAYNEPDSANQANVSVAKALDSWPAFMDSGLRLGSPAPTDNAEGRAWLDEFMTGIAQRGYRVDFIALHYYRDSGHAGFFRLAEQMHEKYGLPIWVTEFGRVDWTHHDVTEAQQAAFLKGIMENIDAYPYIERIAYFARQDSEWRWMNTEGDLNQAGRAYQALAPRHALPFNFSADNDSLGWTVPNGTLLKVENGFLSASTATNRLTLENQNLYQKTDQNKGLILSLRMDQPGTLKLNVRGTEQTSYPVAEHATLNYNDPGEFRNYWVDLENAPNLPAVIEAMRLEIATAAPCTLELDFIRPSFGDYNTDGILDAAETSAIDRDRDGIPDWLDDDIDGDGRNNFAEEALSQTINGGGFELTFLKWEDETFKLAGVTNPLLDGNLRGTTNATPFWIEPRSNSYTMHLDGDLYDQLFVKMAFTDGLPDGDTFIIRWQKKGTAETFESQIPTAGGTLPQSYHLDLGENPNWADQTITALSVSPIQAPNRSFEIEYVAIQEKDSDRDGYSDRVERALGRDPYDGYLFADFEPIEVDQWKTDQIDDFRSEDGRAKGRNKKNGTGQFEINNLNFQVDGDDVSGIWIQFRILDDTNEYLFIVWQNSESDTWHRRRSAIVTDESTRRNFIDLSTSPEWSGKTITAFGIKPNSSNKKSFEIDWIRPVYNASPNDSDRDTLPDDSEGTIDTDSDGIPDFLDHDSDNDSYPDKAESAFGTDSINPSKFPVLRISSATTAQDELSFRYRTPKAKTFTYKFETTTDLENSAWTTLNQKRANQGWEETSSILETDTEQTTEVRYRADTRSIDPKNRFYRLKATKSQ